RLYLGTRLTIMRRPQRASIRPPTPPAPARSTLSTTNCRINLRRPAPSAARMAISLCRVVPRASSMLATFAPTISSTKVTAPRSNAEHGVRFAIERNRLPNDVGIRREVTLPVLVAQDHSLGFVLGKRAPADGIYAQNAK